MDTVVTAIYEKGMLRLLTPLNLPEQSRVTVRLLPEERPEEKLRRDALAILEQLGYNQIEISRMLEQVGDITSFANAEELLAHIYRNIKLTDK